MRVLGVHAIVDEATVYASWWISRILGAAGAKGHQTSQLTGAMVTEQGLLMALQSYVPDVVVLGGHGDTNIFTGAGMQVILRACTNDQMMEGTQSMFVSCLCGIQLVPSIVRKGGLVSQGYVKEFVWMIDGMGNPASDNYAFTFERMLVESATAYFEKVKTGDLEAAWRAWFSTFHRVGKEELAYWGSSSDPSAPSVMMCIRQDLSAIVVNGAGVMDGFHLGRSPLVLPAMVAAAYWYMRKG